MTADTARSVNLDYYEAFAANYDLFFANLRGNMEKEGDWLDAVLRCEDVSSVLDASCGTGRQAIPLAARGYQVTGADPCSAMLREASRLAQEAGLDLSLVTAAFTQLPRRLHSPFDAVLALGNGLCNQERREDIVESLRAMRQVCRRQGPCLIGIKDFDAIRRDRPRFHGRQVRDCGEERTMLFEVWDYADPILIVTAYTVSGHSAAWSVHCAETREYMLGAEELVTAAREAGFGSIERLDHPSEAVYALR